MTQDTVTVRLAYGETGLEVELPADRTTVVEPTYVEAAEDQVGLLRDALRHPVAGPPLRELVTPGQTVAISMCDGTRPQPRHLMIPAVLDELDGIVSPDDVVVLVATGTHRGNSEAEIRQMLGDAVGPGPGGQPRRPRRRVAGLAGAARPRRTRVPEPALGRGRRPDHHRLRRAALLRRLQRRPQAGRARARRAGDGADPARRRSGSATRAPPGRWSRATRCTTTSGPSSRRSARSTSGSTWCSTASSGSSRRSAARCPRCTRPPARPRSGWRCSRCRRCSTWWSPRNSGFPLDQNLYQAVKGMSAGMHGGPAGRHDRLRRRVPRRVPRPRLLPRGAGLRGLPAGAARDDRRARAHRPRPVAGPGPGQGPVARRVVVRSSYLSADDLPPRTSGTPRTSRRRCSRRCTGPARTPGSACSPRARRPSPTSPDRRPGASGGANSRRPGVSGGLNPADPASLAA